MSAQHTPGPWRYVSRNIDEKANWASRIPFAIEWVPERGGGVAPIADVVANAFVEVCAQPQAEGNARLIAAAPELLEALQGYMQAVNTMNAAMKDGINVHGAISGLIGAEDNAKAAIAKASPSTTADAGVVG